MESLILTLRASAFRALDARIRDIFERLQRATTG